MDGGVIAMIEVKNLTRRFGDYLAVDNASFEIPKGSICGFIGPNGSGKTTTMRILSTLDIPTSGHVYVDGLDVTTHPAEVRRTLGYMPDYYGAYPNMLVSEYLEFFARSYGLGRQERVQRTNDVAGFTELDRLMGRPVEGLSKGQKQRLSLARALLPDPSILVMDEPAAGLDPRARIELRELLLLLSGQGKTIFISSHILPELGDFIDQLVVINHSKIRFAGPADSFRKGQSADGSTSLAVAVEVVSDHEAAKRFMLEQQAITKVVEAGSEFHLAVDENVQAIDALLAAMIAANIKVRQCYLRVDSLEDFFLEMTSGEPEEVA